MFTTKNIGKAFKFTFEGENWISRMLISGLLMLSGIGMLAVWGYGIQIIRQMVINNSDTLEPPSWNNIGDNFIDGLKHFVVAFVWSLPILIIQIIFLIVKFLILLSFSENASDETSLIFLLTGSLSYIILIIYAIFLVGFRPAILGELASKGTIKAGLNFKNIFKITKGHYWKNIGFGIIAMITVFANTIAGLNMCLIGLAITLPFGFNFMFHIFGQSYLEMME